MPYNLLTHLVINFFPGNAYNQEERYVCAGYDNGDLKMFDLRMMSVKWETNLKNGVRLLSWSRNSVFKCKCKCHKNCKSFKSGHILTPRCHFPHVVA